MTINDWISLIILICLLTFIFGLILYLRFKSYRDIISQKDKEILSLKAIIKKKDEEFDKNYSYISKMDYKEYIGHLTSDLVSAIKLTYLDSSFNTDIDINSTYFQAAVLKKILIVMGSKRINEHARMFGDEHLIPYIFDILHLWEVDGSLLKVVNSVRFKEQN